jgi:hypothetical protein
VTRRPEDPDGAPRAQRLLAVMAASVIGLCVLDIAALLIARGAGVPDASFHSGLLAIVQILPLPGLIIGLLLALAVIAIGLVSRVRAR